MSATALDDAKRYLRCSPLLDDDPASLLEALTHEAANVYAFLHKLRDKGRISKAEFRCALSIAAD